MHELRHKTEKARSDMIALYQAIENGFDRKPPPQRTAEGAFWFDIKNREENYSSYSLTSLVSLSYFAFAVASAFAKSFSALSGKDCARRA